MFLPIVIAIAWGLPPLAVSPTPSVISSPLQEINEPGSYQNQSKPNLASNSSDKQRSGRAKHQKEKAGRWEKLVAKATVWIAAFTVLLFVATILLYLGARKHSERELRAYISVNPKWVLAFNRTPPQRITIECFLTNHGQTPAFNITNLFEIGIFVPDFQTPIAAHRTIPRNAVVFPKSDLSTYFMAPNVFTSQEVTDVEQGIRRIFIWGTITYRDAFKKTRYTRFSASAGGPDFATWVRGQRPGQPTPRFRWSFGDHHNEAT